MKKQGWFILTTLVLVLVLLVAVGCGQKANIGEVSKDKDDEAAIKEVVEAYYTKAKNFAWDNYDKEAGLEFWTAEGRKQYLAEEAESFAESVKQQKISNQLKGIEFQDIDIEGQKAVVSLVSQEECTSKVTEGLNGTFQGYGTLELQKNEQTWQIENYNFHLVKIVKQ